jgi:dihydroorotate dehydrogenase electron transfer subunit
MLSLVVQVEAPILANRAYSGGYFILTLHAPEIARRTEPGQFVMAAPADGATVPSPLLKRALAVYSIPDARQERSQITLLLKVVGEGTRRITLARPGDRLELIGPLGRGFDLGRAQGKINLIVVGGTGVASALLLAENLVRAGEEVHLVYGGRTSDDLVGTADFQRLGIPAATATEDGGSGLRGLVTECLEQYLRQFPSRVCNAYTCGPNAMMRAVTRITEDRGIPCQISVEVKMACGFGVCLGCTVKTTRSLKLACTHGPVFDASEFVWEPVAERALP